MTRKRNTAPWPATRPRALGPVQRAVLWALLCTPAMTVDEVARDLGRTPKLVWAALDRLHGFGLVVRWGHEVTPQGATPWVYAATKLGRRELNARTGGRMVAK